MLDSLVYVVIIVCCLGLLKCVVLCCLVVFDFCIVVCGATCVVCDLSYDLFVWCFGTLI